MSESGTFIKPWARTIIIFPAFLIVVGLFEFIAYSILGLNPLHENVKETPLQLTISASFSLAGTLLLVWLFSRYIDKIKFRELGFDSKGRIQQLALGILLGAILLSIGFIILLVFNQIYLSATSLLLGEFITEVVLFVLVAFSEEILLRGYVLNNWMQSVNREWALVISALMFSFIHILNPNFSWIGFINIFLAGVLLGLPYIYTRQLWLPIALHFSWNFFQGPVYGFNVSGQEITSLVNQVRTADTIWNGGKFGFEGSLFCTILQLMAIGGLWWYYHQKQAVIIDREVSEISAV